MPDPMKIVVDVVNSEKIQQLNKLIEQQKEEILKWNSAMKGASATQQQVLQTNMANAGKTIANASVQIKSLEPAATAAGRGLSQLSYAVDDIQYGFNAIVNNIPQIAMGFGAGAGLAGVIGIAAVAINQLVKHWSELSDIAQSMWSGSSLEQLQQLREKADAATEAFEKLAEAPNKAKAASGKGISELVTEGPTEKILKDTLGAIAADPLLGKKAEIKELSDAEKSFFGVFGLTPATDDPRKRKALQAQAQKEADEANLKKAKELLGAASTGDAQAMQTLEALVARHPGAFPDEFMQDIKNQTPEGKERIEQQRHQAEHDRIARKEDQKFEENKAKEAKKARIEGLEDEREQIQKAQRDFDEQMWQKQHAATQQQGQMFSGAKSFIDYYHGANTGGDDPKALAKQAHEQRKKTNDLLEDIDKQMKKERRLVVPS